MVMYCVRCADHVSTTLSPVSCTHIGKMQTNQNQCRCTSWKIAARLKETVKRVEQRSGQESKKFGVFGSSSFTMGNVIVEQCGDYCEDYQYGSAPMWIRWSSGCSQ
jgi:hypothetical protein